MEVLLSMSVQRWWIFPVEERNETYEIETERKKYRKVILVLAILVFVSGAGLLARYVYLRWQADRGVTITLPDNVIESQEEPEGEPDVTFSEEQGQATDARTLNETSGLQTGNIDMKEATSIELFRRHSDWGKRFEAKNMLPGDRLTENYLIRVYHDDDLHLAFRADVTSETKHLGNVLRIRIMRSDTGEVLMDEPFSSADGKTVSVPLLASEEGISDVYYRVEVFLDTDVGNAYQAAMLEADFTWFVLEEQALTAPKTGETVDVVLWSMFAVSVSMLAILLMQLWRRKEEQDEIR